MPAARRAGHAYDLPLASAMITVMSTLRRASRLLLVVAPLAFTAVGAGGGAPDALDRLLERHVAARGGREALRAVRTAKLWGRFYSGPGAPALAMVELAREPARVHTWIDFDGRVFEQGWDGREGWVLNPFRGDTLAQPLPPEEAKNVAAGADIDGPLVDWRAKHEQMALAGLDTAAGRPAWKLVVTRPDSLVDDYWLDTLTLMQTKWRAWRTQAGQKVEFESYFGDYQRVGGVDWALRIDSGTPGVPGGQHFVFDSVRVGLPLDPSRFERPPARR